MNDKMNDMTKDKEWTILKNLRKDRRGTENLTVIKMERWLGY